jgi:chemotaxis protein MotB
MPAVEEDEKPEVADWVVTFGDMMSLLLTFFIMLFSMSEIKEEQRYQAMMEALRQRFGYDASILNLMPGQAKPLNSAMARLASLGRARRANTMKGGDKVKAPVGDNPRVRTIKMASQTTVGGVVYFQEGSAELTQEDEQALRATAEAIGGKPQKIELRGHTSMRPLPPGSPYKSHWDLAYDRSRRVMQFLIKVGINPKRIRIAVAADNEPKHVGIDPLLRKENDRVEICMLNELTKDLKGAAEEKP